MAKNKTTVKDLIASELSHFLLREDIKPELIKIEVHYKETIASKRARYVYKKFTRLCKIT